MAKRSFKFTDKKHTKQGIASSVLGIAALVLLTAGVLLAYRMAGEAGAAAGLMGFLSLIFSIFATFQLAFFGFLGIILTNIGLSRKPTAKMPKIKGFLQKTWAFTSFIPLWLLSEKPRNIHFMQLFQPYANAFQWHAKIVRCEASAQTR